MKENRCARSPPSSKARVALRGGVGGGGHGWFAAHAARRCGAGPLPATRALRGASPGVGGGPPGGVGAVVLVVVREVVVHGVVCGVAVVHGGDRGMVVHGVGQGCISGEGTSEVPRGFFRIIKNQGGGDPSPKAPSPPPPKPPPPLPQSPLSPSPKAPSPPPQTKVTKVGKNEIYNRENLVRPFLVHQDLGPKPPPPLPPPCSKEALRCPQ